MFGIFEDDFPFPQVGYVSSLEGIYLYEPSERNQICRQMYCRTAIRSQDLKTDLWDAFTKNFRYLKGIGILTYISCMDTAYVRENPSPKIAL